MGSQTTKIVAVIVVLAASFIAYKLLHKSYDPIHFMGETYEFSEDQSPNDQVEVVLFTPNGESQQEADRWIEKVSWEVSVSEQQRDMVDRQIRTSMGVTPIPGHEYWYFGKFQGAALHILLLESQYILYAYSDTGSIAELQAAAPAIFAEMELTFMAPD